MKLLARIRVLLAWRVAFETQRYAYVENLVTRARRALPRDFPGDQPPDAVWLAGGPRPSERAPYKPPHWSVPVGIARTCASCRHIGGRVAPMGSPEPFWAVAHTCNNPDLRAQPDTVEVAILGVLPTFGCVQWEGRL